MPTKTYESENKKFIIDAITNTYDIDPNKISIKSQWGWNFILFSGEYEICHFTEDAKK